MKNKKRLDVLLTENPELETHPLMGRTNVIITPHCAFYSRTSEYENRRISVQNVVDCLTGRVMEAAVTVNPEAWLT